MRYLLSLSVLSIVLSSGCTSFSTTVMQRCMNGVFHYNAVCETKGIPVKLKVPTHIEVIVTEDFFIEKDSKGKFKEIPIVRDSDDTTEIRSLNVATKVIYTDKVFTVDFKRPAGGTLALGSDSAAGVTFDDEQYFQKIQASYTEKTLEDINTALGTLKPSLTSAKKTSKPDDAAASKLGTEVREVARSRFDISDPSWEDQMHGFVEEHVTSCYADCHYQN